MIVLVVLIAFRIALPYIVKSYVNKTLADLPGYPGYIADVDMDLWRGAYVIKDLNIEKVDAKIPVPFFSSKQIDLSIEWGALLHASLVGKIKFIDPRISFVQGPTEKESQNGGGTNFIETIKKLFPVKINRFDVQNGEVHFRNFHSNPKVDIHLDSLFLHASNLTNSKSLSKTLVATVDARGKVMGTGRLKGHLDINPYAAQPTFKLDFQVEQVELTTINNFFDAYASIDVKSWVFQMYSGVAAADGKFTGYVKPLFKDMMINVNYYSRSGTTIFPGGLSSLVGGVGFSFCCSVLLCSLVFSFPSVGTGGVGMPPRVGVFPGALPGSCWSPGLPSVASETPQAGNSPG